MLAAAHGLAARGHEVVIACPSGSALAARVDPALCDVVALGEAESMAAAWTLRQVVALRRVDALIVDTDGGQLAAALAARWGGTPCAAVVRRLPTGAPVARTWRWRAAARLAPLQVIVPSQADARAWQRALEPGATPTVAPLGVDAAAYDAVRPATTGSIGTVGGSRMMVCVTSRAAGSARGASHALRVMGLLAAHHADLRFVLVGPGSDDDDLRMHAAALRLTRTVRALGERPDVAAVLAAAELGWVAAVGDDRAFACLDLAAVGVPVLATRDAVTERVVADGISGVLVPPDDPAAGAAAAARLLARAEERAAMGRAARTRVQREFPSSVYVDALEQALARALPAPAPRAAVPAS